MAVSIHFCISQALAETLRRQLYQAPVSKVLLASTGGEALGPIKVICPRIGNCQGQEAGMGGLVSGGGEKG